MPLAELERDFGAAPPTSGGLAAFQKDFGAAPPTPAAAPVPTPSGIGERSFDAASVIDRGISGSNGWRSSLVNRTACPGTLRLPPLTVSLP